LRFLALADGRLLSWSSEPVLRLWDSAKGIPLAVLEGHTGWVHGALALPDGRILSWSEDNTLRLWDGLSGAPLAVLEGHSFGVEGALALADGRLLSWSQDRTFRLWDGGGGALLAISAGPTDSMYGNPDFGALALPNGRLLSWSDDKTLRLWDGRNGAPLAVLKGHSDGVTGAQALLDGRLLSWSWKDRTLRLWDGDSGTCLEVAPDEELAIHHPEWLHARTKAEHPRTVVGDFFATSAERTTWLRHKTSTLAIASWQAESESGTLCLLPDGTLVVGQKNGHVCILKLYHGRRRMTLAGVRDLLPLLSNAAQ